MSPQSNRTRSTVLRTFCIVLIRTYSELTSSEEDCPMDTIELAQRAIAELAPLGEGLGLRCAMQVAETDELAPHMLSALLGHELVAGHATMMKLSAKVDRWLALVVDDRSPEDQ